MVDTQTLNQVIMWARSIRVFSTLMTKLTILVSLHCILLHYTLVACLWLLWKVTGCWVNGTCSRCTCSSCSKVTSCWANGPCSKWCTKIGNCICKPCKKCGGYDLKDFDKNLLTGYNRYKRRLVD